MSQVTAGDVITLTIDGHTLEAKVEDASKSEAISVKIESSNSPDYRAGQIVDFNRDVLK